MASSRREVGVLSVALALQFFQPCRSQSVVSWQGVADSTPYGPFSEGVSEGAVSFNYTWEGNAGPPLPVTTCGKAQSLHLFRLSGNTVIATGCVSLCVSQERCNALASSGVPHLVAGVTYTSNDGGVTWMQRTEDIPGLRMTGSTAVSIPGNTANPPIACLLGGWPVRVVDDQLGNRRVQQVGSALAQVVCTRDGLTWVRQMDLPAGRAQASGTMYLAPSPDTLPRMYIAAGFTADLDPDPAQPAQGAASPGMFQGEGRVRVPAADWLLVTNEIPTVRLGEPLPGTLISQWISVGNAPAALRGREFPVLHWYRGIQFSPAAMSDPALVIGLGYSADSEGVYSPSPDLWWSGRPSTPQWRSVPNTGVAPQLPFNYSSHAWPTISLLGVLANNTVQGVDAAFEERSELVLGWDEGGRGLRFTIGRTNTGIAPVYAVCPTSRDPRTATVLSPSISCPGVQQAGPHSLAPVGVGAGDSRPGAVALFRTSVLRMFPWLPDYDCSARPVPGWTSRAGPYLQPLPVCHNCSTCTGAAPDLDPSLRTTLSLPCTTGPSRGENRDTVCKPCRICGEQEVTVSVCTPVNDTVCQASALPPQALRPAYLPTSRTVDTALHTCLLWLPGVALLAALGCVVLYGYSPCMAALRGGVAGGADMGLVATAYTSSASSASSSSSSSSSPAVPGPAKGLPGVGAEQHGLHSTIYASVLHLSAGRESLRDCVLWSASLLWSCLDALLVLCTHASLWSLALSLLGPDAPPPGMRAYPAVQDTFKAYGKGILCLLVLHAVLVTACLATFLARHKLSLSSNTVGPLADWAYEGRNRAALALVLLLLPMHSRLVALLMPGSPLRFPAPIKLATFSAVIAPASLLSLDIPALALVGGTLSYSGYPVRQWLVSGAQSEASPPALARTALALTVANLLWTVLKVVWDFAACARAGGVYRFRRAVLILPEWHWYVSLLLPSALHSAGSGAKASASGSGSRGAVVEFAPTPMGYGPSDGQRGTLDGADSPDQGQRSAASSVSGDHPAIASMLGQQAEAHRAVAPGGSAGHGSTHMHVVFSPLHAPVLAS